VIPAALAVIVLLLWAVVAVMRRQGKDTANVREDVTEDALGQFVVRSLDLGSLQDVLSDAAATATAAFRASKIVVFEPGAKEGQWEVLITGATSAEAAPENVRAVFAWFKHNADIVVLDEIAGPRYGAMRIPLGELKKRYAIDVLLPLVDRGATIGAMGLALGRKPTAHERALLGHLRVEVTAAAANVRLHREAAHKLTLEKEVDLASAVQVALIPPVAEGTSGSLAWVGHYKPAGQAGSDFWSTYDLGGGRMLVVVGDVIGSGLAGSMVSAVAKSCCDALHSAGAAGDAGALLTGLNRSLFRHAKPIQMTCLAAVFDPGRGVVSYANAGHPMPYVVKQSEPRLGVLNGSGPMLGDAADTKYVAAQKPLGRGDVVLLYTDGIVEAMNAQRAPFGERRLQRSLVAAADMAPGIARDRLLAAVEEFRAGQPPADDEALVLVRVT
jgi:serine phosphatase RsbU (regulator of sigma subunit)